MSTRTAASGDIAPARRGGAASRSIVAFEALLAFPCVTVVRGRCASSARASLDARLEQGERARVGVELGQAPDGQRGLILDVADHEAGHGGHAEGAAALGEDVLEEPVLDERRRGLTARELAEGHAGDAVEPAREPELGQEAVDTRSEEHTS